MGDELGNGEMGHEDGPVNNDQPVKEVSVQGRSLRKEESCHHKNVHEGKYEGEKIRGIKNEDVRMECILGRHEGMNPVVEKESRYGHDKEGGNEGSSHPVTL